jgi:hypothetical protein
MRGLAIRKLQAMTGAGSPPNSAVSAMVSMGMLLGRKGRRFLEDINAAQLEATNTPTANGRRTKPRSGEGAWQSCCEER